MDLAIDTYVGSPSGDFTLHGRVVSSYSRKNTQYHVTGWQLRDDVHETLIRILGDYVFRWDGGKNWSVQGTDDWYVSAHMTKDQMMLVKLSI